MNDSDFKTGWKHENTGGKWGGKRQGGESMDQKSREIMERGNTILWPSFQTSKSKTALLAFYLNLTFICSVFQSDRITTSLPRWKRCGVVLKSMSLSKPVFYFSMCKAHKLYYYKCILSLLLNLHAKEICEFSDFSNKIQYKGNK